MVKRTTPTPRLRDAFDKIVDELIALGFHIDKKTLETNQIEDTDSPHEHGVITIKLAGYPRGYDVLVSD